MGKKIIIEAYGLTTRAWTLHEKYGYGCSECCNGDRCDEDCTAKYKGNRAGCPHCKGKGWIPASEATLKTMESNKSKGVEFRNELQNRVESLLYDTLNQDFRNRKDVCKALQDIVDEALAHSQQSEATLTDHAISIGTPIQTTAAASEGVEDRWKYEVAKEAVDHVQLPAGWKAEATADGKIRITPPPKAEGVGQAAEGDLDNLVWAVETGRCSIKSAVRLAYQRATAFHPSEPAALKEFYCIGDKDNLFQCEEQCEDCKKEAALKDGEIESIAIELISKHGRWVEDEMEYQASEYEFTAALKEFASLLTNHKS